MLRYFDYLKFRLWVWGLRRKIMAQRRRIERQNQSLLERLLLAEAASPEDWAEDMAEGLVEEIERRANHA